MLASQGPVGTRGGVEWMRGPCACPGWGATCLLHKVPNGARCHQEAQGLHPAPHPPLVPTGPHSVVNIHQGDCSTCQVQFVQIEPCLTAIITKKPESTISIALSGSRVAGKAYYSHLLFPRTMIPILSHMNVPPRTSPTWLSPTHYGTLYIVVFWLTSCQDSMEISRNTAIR